MVQAALRAPLRLALGDNTMTRRFHPGWMAASVLPAALLAGCGGSDGGLPQLAAATPATLQSCSVSAPIEF